MSSNMHKKRNSPWVWIPSLFATEAIVSATITYVALLMFVQLGASYSKAAFLSAALMIPSVIKPYIHIKPKYAKYLKSTIVFLQMMLFIAFVVTAFVINSPDSNIYKVFASLMAVAFLNAVNERVISLYYYNVTEKTAQNFLANYKFVSTQISFILTYGILIIFVGFHEIFFRNMTLAWSMEYYVVAGVLLILLMFNTLLMQKPKEAENLDTETHVRLKQERKIYRKFIVVIAILLLPQSLLFCTRVFFLMAPESAGGLGCTLQDVGFAQGTIGVIAFMTGTFIGQHLLRRYGNKRMFWSMTLPLLFSPFFYLMMNLFIKNPNMLDICLMTTGSQLCFGFGLNICIIMIKKTTDVFDDNILSLVHLPVVSVSMALPISLSGFLLSKLSFTNFFILLVGLSFLSLIVILVQQKFINRQLDSM